MKNIKLIFIAIFFKINVNLVFKIKTTLTENNIIVNYKLRDWCKNGI
jgi:hypothetical protein